MSNSTPRGSNVWQTEGGDDILQIKSPAGTVVSWIDSTGTPQGNLANGSGGGAVSSVFGRTGIVTAQSGDYSYSQLGGTANLVTSGLIGQYQILPTETAAALVDYSGSGNNATGTVGTAPTIQSGTGGLVCIGTGAVSLPAALNAARTIMVFMQFNVNAIGLTGGVISPYGVGLQAPVMGNDSSSFVGGVGNACGIVLRGGPGITGDAWGNTMQGGCAPRVPVHTSNTWGNSFLGVFEGVGSIALVQPGTSDLIYINGNVQEFYQSGVSTAGQQTAGNYQLGGCASGSGFQSLASYFTGIIYYALFYNRALSAQEIAQNHQAMAAAMALRGVNTTVTSSNPLNVTNLAGSKYPDLIPQVVFRGDSITHGIYSSWMSLVTPSGVGSQALQLNNLGNPGDGVGSFHQPYETNNVDTMYRDFAPGNLCFEWMGANDDNIYDIAAKRSWAVNRKKLGWMSVPVTVTSQVGETNSYGSGGGSTIGGNTSNDWLRQNWKTFGDGLCDIASLPNLGAIGAYLNTTYFPDGLHPSAVANQYLVAPLFTRMIDRAFGYTSFSSAYTAQANSGPSFYQGGLNTIGNTGSYGSITFTKPNLPGSALFLVVYTSNNTNLSSVTDSNNNTWQLLVTLKTGYQIWYAYNVKGGLNTVTAGFGSGNVGYQSFLIAEYTGISGAYTQQANAHYSTPNTSYNSGNITTTVNGSLILGIGIDVANGTSTTAGSGFTLDVGGAAGKPFIESEVQAVAGSIAATATASAAAAWYIAAVSFSPNTNTLYVQQDKDVYLNVNPATASMTVQLVPAAGLTSQRVHIKNVQKTGANSVTLVPDVACTIASVSGNGTTVTYTVSNTYKLIAGMTVNIAGCTTAGFNGVFTIASVPSTTTFTVTNSTNASESETNAYVNCETIDGNYSLTVSNNAEIALESVINPNTAVRGCNWITVTN